MADPNALLSVSDLQLAFGHQTVLDGATVAVCPGDKVGLVGRNGCGKSSFLKIVAGEDEPDAGTVSLRNGLSVGYLSQEFTLDDSRTVLENVRDGVAEILGAVARYERGEGVSEHEMDALLTRIEAADGWNVDTRVETVMRALSVPPADRVVHYLSGGERRRVALARALVSQPDLLVLDEPTNHLDTDSILWLEGFLTEARSACLFVTHDRYFLDRIATRIVELSGGAFFSHEGNYSDYLVAKAERQGREEAAEGRRQRFLKREVEWVRAGIKARGTKQRSRLDNYYAVKAQKAPEKELDMHLVLPPPSRLGNVVVEADGVGATLTHEPLFYGLDLSFKAGQCTGVVGRNGAGKTTLLRILMGDIAPTDGRVTIGKRTEFNYVDQTRLQLDAEKSVLEEVAGKQDFVQFGDERLSVRGYLRRFLFTDERINDRVGNLSGGEKSRVLLAKILRRGGNFLVLDEPTNDLDLPTLRVLEEAVVNFAGSTLVVSHDRYFLDRVCDRIVAFEGGGQVFVQEGNYSYYLEKRKGQLERSAPAEKKATKPRREKQERPRKLTWKEERELEAMEGKILAAEEAVSALEAELNDPDFYKKAPEKAAERHASLEEAQKEVSSLYERWEELEAVRLAAEG